MTPDGAAPKLTPEQEAAVRGMEHGTASSPGGEGAPPPGSAPSPGASDGEREAAGHAAGLVVDALAGLVSKRWPETAYTAEEKTAAASVIAPLFIKYGITPAWLERWREEMAAGLVIGGLAYAGYSRVRAARTSPPPSPGAPGAPVTARFTETTVRD